MERIEPRSPELLFFTTLVISVGLHVVIGAHLPNWTPSTTSPRPFLVEMFTTTEKTPPPLQVPAPAIAPGRSSARPRARLVGPAQPAPQVPANPVGTLVVPEGKPEVPLVPFVPLVGGGTENDEPALPAALPPDREPRLLEELRVAYPAQARDADIEGEVELRVTIDTDGRVLDAIVLRGPGYGLDRAALDAVRHSRWAPGIREGQAAKRTLVWIYRFVLQ